MKVKAANLMINDWVYDPDFKDKRPIRIARLVNLDIEYEPIPLTAEILEKNNFTKGDLNISPQYTRTIGKSTISVTLNSTPDQECMLLAWNADGKVICSLENLDKNNCQWYVHQLQHILKNCNIEKDIII